MILAGVVGRAEARDIFVDNARGDDRYSGAQTDVSPVGDGPVRTLTRALALARSSDRIVVVNTGVPYRESISLATSRHSGQADAPFEIEGNGAVLDGTRLVPDGAWQHYRGKVFRFAPPKKGTAQLFRGERPLVRQSPQPTAAEPPELEPLAWCYHRGYIYFCAEQDRLPASYALRFSALPVGITLYKVRGVVINDLIVQGYQLDGIHAHDALESTSSSGEVRRCAVVGVTCRGNGRAGVAVAGASRIELVDCLLGDNGTAQLYTQGRTETHVFGSELLPQSAPAIVNDGGRVFVDGKPYTKADPAKPGADGSTPAAVGSSPARPRTKR